MKNILHLLCLFASFSLSSQAPAFEWVNQVYASGGQSGHDITTDKYGDVYVTGSFSGTADFDPGPDTFNLVSELDMYGYGSTDIFVAKYDSAGQFIWAVSFGDDENDRGHSINTDTFGNVYITGTFDGTIDFDPGPGVYNLSSGLFSSFILKLDTNGNFIWVGKLDTLLNSNNQFIIDEAGNLYLTGRYAGTDDFDPGPEEYNVSGFGAFILKLDQDGNFLWVKTLESDVYAEGNAVTLDSLGNIYVVGRFNGNTDFDPNSGEFILTEVGPTGRDIFILKLDSVGDFIWAKQITSLDADHVYFPNVSSIAVNDDQEGVYITGWFDETCDFDPGLDSFNVVANGISNIFVLKLDVDGNFVWVKSIGGQDLDGGTDIALDNNGNIYLTGVFRGTADFDPGNGIQILSTPALDVMNTFILKLAPDGNYLWAGSFLGSGFNNGRSLTLDTWENVYTTGLFASITTDFDPDTSTYIVSGSGLFIHKMRPRCNTTLKILSDPEALLLCPGDTSITLTASLTPWVSDLSYFWNTGDTLTSITVFPDSTTSYSLDVSYMEEEFVCNSSTSIELVVIDSLAISIPEDQEVCAQEEITLEASGGISYLWDTGDTTNTLSVIGLMDQVHTVTIVDDNGCSVTDSVLVRVNQLSDTTQLSATTCDTLATGIFEYIYGDQNGCDSVVVESVAFVPIPEAPVAPVDIVIQENEPPFQISILEMPNATSYLWTVPVGANILSGQGTNSIIVDWNGSTTTGSICVGAMNECGSSPTVCMEVMVEMIDGLSELKQGSYAVFPNPTDEILNIVFEDKKNYEFSLLNAFGRLVMPSTTCSGQAQIETKNLPAGVYWLKIKCLDCTDGERFFWGRVEVL